MQKYGDAFSKSSSIYYLGIYIPYLIEQKDCRAQFNGKTRVSVYSIIDTCRSVEMHSLLNIMSLGGSLEKEGKIGKTER